MLFPGEPPLKFPYCQHSFSYIFHTLKQESQHGLVLKLIYCWLNIQKCITVYNQVKDSLYVMCRTTGKKIVLFCCSITLAALECSLYIKPFSSQIINGRLPSRNTPLLFLYVYVKKKYIYLEILSERHTKLMGNQGRNN